MSKNALTISAAQIETVLPMLVTDKAVKECVIYDITPVELFNLAPTLMPRDVCETDPSHLQIIPYTTLVRQNESGMLEVLTYTRSKASTEGRLHGLCSVGLGGHIEVAPTDGSTLKDVVLDAMVREIKEEVGLEFSAPYLKHFSLMYDRSVAVMYNNTDEVGRVHLGLSLIVFLDDDHVSRIVMDQVEITNATWVPINELINPAPESDIKLEKWSELVMYSLCAKYNENLDDQVSAIENELSTMTRVLTERLEAVKEVRDNCHFEYVTAPAFNDFLVTDSVALGVTPKVEKAITE